MTRLGERGSVVGFIVVGVVLAAVVAGGIIMIRQIGQPAEVAVDQDSKTDETDSSKEADAPINEDKSSESTDKKTDDKKDTESGKTDKTEETKAPDQEVAESTVDSKNDTEEQSTTGGEASDTLAQAGQLLPQTGPGDVMATGAIIAILLGSIAAYRRSLQV